MKVFCPNCGSENEGMEGGRLTCHACTASFEVRSPTQPEAQRPLATPVAHPPPANTGWVGPAEPVAGMQAPQPGGVSTFAQAPAAGTNPLAIVSLVAGIICCIPVISPATAIGCGIVALKQIDASGGNQKGRGLAIAGIALGGLTVMLNILGLISSIING